MAKKIYVKPQIKKVKLLPQEAVLTNCKTDSGGPASTRPCNVQHPAPCQFEAAGT